MVADFLEKTLKTISKTQRTDSRVDTLLPNAKLFPRVSYVQCHDRLGGILVSAGKLTQEELFMALKLQKDTNVRLGDILVARGLCDENIVYEALAEQFGVYYVNLDIEPLDQSLLQSEDVLLYLQHHCVPWRSSLGGIVFATTNIEALSTFIEQKDLPYGNFNWVVVQKSQLVHHVYMNMAQILVTQVLESNLSNDNNASIRVSPLQKLLLWCLLGVASFCLIFYPQVLGKFLIIGMLVVYFSNIFVRLLALILELSRCNKSTVQRNWKKVPHIY